VDEVDARVDPLAASPERSGVEQVAADDLDTVGPRPIGDAAGIANEYANLVIAIEQARDEPPPDVPGRSGDENLHGRESSGPSQRR